LTCFNPPTFKSLNQSFVSPAKIPPTSAPATPLSPHRLNMLSFLVILVISSVGNALLPEGSRCITTTLSGANEKCEPGLDCLIWHHGIPSRSIENSGTCVRYGVKRADLKQCSIEFCSSHGHTAVCIDTIKPVFRTSTCGAFATRQDGGRKPNCAASLCNAPKCPKNSGNMLRSSMGKWYCGACNLKFASCNSGFKEYGPMAFGTSDNGAECSYNRRSDKLCKSVSTCLISRFPSPTDETKPVNGKCVPAGKFAVCSVHFCSSFGPKSICNTPIQDISTTCEAWSSRPDFGPRVDCNLNCIRGYCESPKPKDNTGKEHCSQCHLRRASCEANFKTFAKLKPRIAQMGWLCSTNNPQLGPTMCAKGSVCLIQSFGHPPSGFSNAGVCVGNTGPIPMCDMKSCNTGEENEDRERRCRTKDTKDVTTCAFWRFRSE